MEVLLLSLLRHSNLVCLIGYCTDGDQRLLVYEYMPMGSLEDHLFGMFLAMIWEHMQCCRGGVSATSFIFILLNVTLQGKLVNDRALCMFLVDKNNFFFLKKTGFNYWELMQLHQHI